MPLDTVKLKSPYISKKDWEKISMQGAQTRRVDLKTGEIEMEIVRTPLRGSWDSRISVIPENKEHGKNFKTGRVEEHPSPPFLYVECSLPKIFHGHNVYGGQIDFQLAIVQLVKLLEELLGVKLPDAADWWVHRIDWAECFVIGQDACHEYFDTMKNARFPRRKVSTHASTGLYAPGTTTTLKLYHKGSEFAQHDAKRIERSLRNIRTQQFSQDKFIEENQEWVRVQLNELQEEANNRLRVEVEIHLEKLDHDFNHKPRVHEITTEYLTSTFDNEVYKMMRQGKNPDIVLLRNSKAILQRLSEKHSPELTNRLHAFWNQLATVGEEKVRASYSRPTFYRNRKLLEDAGITWHQADSRLIERESSDIPIDFAPVRSDPRRCTREVCESSPLLIKWDYQTKPLEAIF